MMELIKNMVRLEVERVVASRRHPRNAVVTSVDPDTYSAKVRYEPHDPNDADNAEGGWIPLHAQATGTGFGMFMVPKVGDPVEVAFQEGDHMTGRVQSRHVSEQHQPPEGMKEGEYHIVHPTGAAISVTKDGTVSFRGAGSVKPRAAVGGSGGSGDSGSGSGQQQQEEQPQAKQTVTLAPDGSLSIKHKNGATISMDKDGNVGVDTNNKDITINAGTGAQTLTAKTFNMKGDLKVDGAVASTGLISGQAVTSGGAFVRTI